MEDGNQINKVQKNKKKDKRKPENDQKESAKKEKGCLRVDMTVTDLVDDSNNKYEKVKKKNKKDRKKAEVGTGTSNAEIRGKELAEENGIKQSEKDKKKKNKNKRNSEVGSETTFAEARGKDPGEADDNYQNENETKIMKQKRSEQVLHDQPNVEICDAEIGKMGDRKISMNGGDRKERKKKRSKEEGRKHEDESVFTPKEILSDNEHVISHKASSVKMNNEEDRTRKKKKKIRRNEEDGCDPGKDESADVDEETLNSDINVADELSKVREISLKTKSIPMGYEEQKSEKKKKVREVADNREKIESMALEVGGKTMESDINVSEKVGKKRKREKSTRKDLKKGEVTTPSTTRMTNGCEIEGNEMSNDNEINADESNSKDPKAKKKKVSFSDHNDVFPFEGELVQGKRFTPEEDELVKKAVFDYIKAHDLGDEGLAMVLNCKAHSKLKNCWKEIGEAIPYRPYKSVYDRAHNLFERAEERVWDEEEFEIIRKYHAEHGPKWKQLADAMGKHRRHLKDAWRRTKLLNKNKGHWSQEEYQNLFDLVNLDLKAKVNEEKKSKHGMLRDNISWTAIADRFGARNFVSCCDKWYDQLTSSMVKEGEWADSDDYRLIDALYTLDACCIEDVDWDSLLEHRSGDLCRKRWNQMSNHIGENGKKSFAEQVEVLSNRYCPELLEAREIWDSKPVVS